MATNQKKAYPPITQASKKQHTEMVRDIFATIPEGYDLLNRILSLRRDVAWRRFAVRKMKFFKTTRLLDLATGTADLAMEATLAYPKINVVALDFVQEMIVRGQRKIEKQGLSKRIQLLQADAVAVPIDDGAFVVASIAFGIPLQFDKVAVEGISAITAADINYAEALGYRIKLLGIARRSARGIELRVHPTLIPERRLIANVNGVMNAVLVMINTFVREWVNMQNVMVL